VDDIMDAAKENTARDLGRAHARHEPEAIKQVNRVLAYSGLTLHDIMAKGLTGSSRSVQLFLDLGVTALANKFLAREELSRPEPAYPLRVGFCHTLPPCPFDRDCPTKSNV
jgi:hypothetical protein